MHRFDEILSSKASKVALEEVQREFEHYLKTSSYKIDQKSVEQKLTHFSGVADTLQKEFKALNEVVDTEIKTAVRKGVKELKNEMYNKFSGGNSSRF